MLEIREYDLGELRDLAGASETRAKIVDLLAIAVGRQKAEAHVSGFEDLVRKRAEEGATRAVKRGLYLTAALVFAPPLLRAILRGVRGRS